MIHLSLVLLNIILKLLHQLCRHLLLFELMKQILVDKILFSESFGSLKDAAHPRFDATLRQAIDFQSTHIHKINILLGPDDVGAPLLELYGSRVGSRLELGPEEVAAVGDFEGAGARHQVHERIGGFLRNQELAPYEAVTFTEEVSGDLIEVHQYLIITAIRYLVTQLVEVQV